MKKISIITCTYNSALTIADTIISVNNQSYENIEHIIIDGLSTDDTLKIIDLNKSNKQIVISEKDKGIYDAMNKGIQYSTGDIIGILNSDDFFSSTTIIEEIATIFIQKKIDALYGDIHFVNPKDINKCVRYYSSKIFKPSLFRFGFMPAHPSFYVKKECYDKFGLYSLDYTIAADYELLIRFLYKEKIKTKYLQKDFVTMRTGGVSTNGIQCRITMNKEIVKACKTYGIYTNLFILFIKYIYKIFEYKLK